MTKKKGKKINVKVEDEADIIEPWGPFRVPTHLESLILDDPWVHPWMQKRGWRNICSGLLFGNRVKEAPIDFKETKKQYEIYAEIPGVSKDKIEVHVTPHNLAIKGTVKIENEKEVEEYIWKERGCSTIARAIHFPDEVTPDNAKAELEDGVLKVTVPKKSMNLEEKGKRILIK
ncbi:MAG: hypothetical protein BV458_05780 [Thermoplasmata archaeon M9B2D]|nr:MAG: hypothetical protein BV458_05780 [Thermoplasmata archaeon M9B2D]